MKDHRLFMIDDESLTLNRIDHYCNMFSSKYPNFNMGVVDYVNIVKHDNQKDWQHKLLLQIILNLYQENMILQCYLHIK